MRRYNINIYGESSVQKTKRDEEQEIFHPIAYLFSCILVAIKNIIFLIIFLTAIALAGVGSVAVYYQPTRTILMQLIHK